MQQHRGDGPFSVFKQESRKLSLSGDHAYLSGDYTNLPPIRWIQPTGLGRAVLLSRSSSNALQSNVSETAIAAADVELCHSINAVSTRWGVCKKA